jgi:hypothetical protein
MISSQLEIIEQAKAFLCELSQFEYQQVIKPHFSSSAGAHMRHIVDHYQALRHGVVTGEVDYNLRNRESDVENNPEAALAAWKDIENWLRQISVQEMDKAMVVKSEVSINSEQNVTCASSLGRELMFVASHAIHHYSLLAIIRSLQGGKNQEAFGVAPATATYRREVTATAN